jgi:hypothetical protein
MLYKMLLPNKFKKIGWAILLPAAILGLILIATGFEGIPMTARVFALFNDPMIGKSQSFGFISTNITNTAVGMLFIAGMLLVAFSKEKNEDEFIASLRQSSLLWAVLINYFLLLFCFAFIYGMAFLSVMVYNIFTVLIIFIIRFNYVLYRNAKSMSDEQHD